MRLAAAASSRNEMPCVDAYTDRLAFRGQLALFDDNKRDSETAQRRIISVAPGVELPSRRVVEAAGSRWILGHTNPDSYRGKVVRVGVVAHEATELARVRTLGEVCRDEAGFEAWAGRAWLKNLAFSEQDSNLTPQSHIFFAKDEPVDKAHLISFGGRLHLVRMATVGPAGMRWSLCDELPEPTVQVAVTTVGVWDPVADAMVGTPTSIRVVRVRWQSLFEYRATIAPTFGPGDIQIAIDKAVAVTPGMVLTLPDGNWKMESASDEGDVWLCRAVRHGS